MSTDRLFGRVKWFNAKQGYGFITDCKSNADVFVHHTGLVAPENVYKTLREGEYVEYGTKVDENGKTVATEVTGINRGPLGCEAMAKRVAERKARVPKQPKVEATEAATSTESATPTATESTTPSDEGFTRVGRRPATSRGARRGGRGGRGTSTRQSQPAEEQERKANPPAANSYAGRAAANKKQ